MAVVERSRWQELHRAVEPLVVVYYYLYFIFKVTVTESHDGARRPIVCCKMRTAMLSFRCISVDCRYMPEPTTSTAITFMMHVCRTNVHSAHINLFMCMDWIAWEFGSGGGEEGIKGKAQITENGRSSSAKNNLQHQDVLKDTGEMRLCCWFFFFWFWLACVFGVFVRHCLTLFSPNFCMWQAVCNGECEILTYGRIRSHYINIVECMRWWRRRRRR